MPNFNVSITMQATVVADSASAAGADIAGLVPQNSATVTIRSFNTSVNPGPATVAPVAPK
jgi:hypothetical protein